MSLKKKMFLFVIVLGALTCSNNAFAFRFVVYSDSEHTNGSYNQEVLGFINSKISSLNPLPAFVCFMGDAVNNPDGTTYLQDWKNFMISTLNGIPFYLVPGETDISPNTQGRVPTNALQENFRTIFNNMPNNGPSNSDYNRLTYFVEHGEGDSKSLFIFLDSYIVESEDPIQYFGDYSTEYVVPWYQNLLSTTTAKHVFVFSHMPFFDPTGVTPLRFGDVNFNPFNGIGASEMCYESKNVDIFFSGHIHLYSRWTLFPSNFIKAPQIITGRCGAPAEQNNDLVVPENKVNTHRIYNYAVVDVDGKNVKVQAFGVIDNGVGNFSQIPIDTALIRK